MKWCMGGIGCVRHLVSVVFKKNNPETNKYNFGHTLWCVLF